MSEDEKSSTAAALPGWAAFLTMGSTIALCEALGVVAGLEVDHHFSTAPVGILIGVVLGTVIAVVSVVRQVRRYL
jgi:F0F1-type ATP synthase assembly protein I